MFDLIDKPYYVIALIDIFLLPLECCRVSDRISLQALTNQRLGQTVCL